MGFIYTLEHAPHEGPVQITQWLADQRISIHPIRLFEDYHFPLTDEVDLLIIMGGLMSINEEEKYPWLIEEKKFITRIVKSGKPVLGICLGAQLLAEVLGGTVTRTDNPEYGWHKVFRTDHQQDDHRKISGLEREIMLPATIEVFQWHQDTFSIPPGAEHLYE